MKSKRIGRAMIFFGVAMWVPYFALELSGMEVPVLPFLALHLAGVIPGAVILRGETLVKTVARWLGRVNDRTAQ